MATKKKQLLLGGHISIAGGFDKAIERGDSIGCTAIQIFTRSNRQWKANAITKEQIAAFKKAQKNSTIQVVVDHLPYLVNIGSPDPKTRHASIAVVKQELKRCYDLGIPYMVMHPGSHLGEGEEKCLERIVKGLNSALEAESGSTMILLENMAGQGTNIGYSFEHLGDILKSVIQKKRVGICFDTCHAFASGYDFRTKKGYDAMWKEFDKQIGLKKLKVIHCNDSKRELGSHVDRHEDIGKGKIGEQTFQLLFNDERFFDIPKLLETPKATLETYAKNMKIIKGLLTDKTKKALNVMLFLFFVMFAGTTFGMQKPLKGILKKTKMNKHEIYTQKKSVSFNCLEECAGDGFIPEIVLESFFGTQETLFKKKKFSKDILEKSKNCLNEAKYIVLMLIGGQVSEGQVFSKKDLTLDELVVKSTKMILDSIKGLTIHYIMSGTCPADLQKPHVKAEMQDRLKKLIESVKEIELCYGSANYYPECYSVLAKEIALELGYCKDLSDDDSDIKINDLTDVQIKSEPADDGQIRSEPADHDYPGLIGFLPEEKVKNKTSDDDEPVSVGCLEIMGDVFSDIRSVFRRLL